MRGTVALKQLYCERTAGGSPLTVSAYAVSQRVLRFAVVWRKPNDPAVRRGEIRDSEFQTANRRVFEGARNSTRPYGRGE